MALPANRVAIALGSNVGDRQGHLEYAIGCLRPLLADMTVSGFLDTEPVGVGPQPRFLNGVVVGAARAAPRELLDALLAIERARGRERPCWGAPRTLDLDLILFGGSIIEEPGLTVPHPRFRERRFVLEPLASIAPEMVDPVTGLTIRELLQRLLGSAIGAS
jgi:2-amino-4-hydroxy-6-hydroxymethyldihydropteridine diphosphokinase